MDISDWLKVRDGDVDNVEEWTIGSEYSFNFSQMFVMEGRAGVTFNEDVTPRIAARLSGLVIE